MSFWKGFLSEANYFIFHVCIGQNTDDVIRSVRFSLYLRWQKNNCFAQDLYWTISIYDSLTINSIFRKLISDPAHLLRYLFRLFYKFFYYYLFLTIIKTMTERNTKPKLFLHEYLLTILFKKYCFLSMVFFYLVTQN